MTRDFAAAGLVALAALLPRIWLLSAIGSEGLFADMVDYFDRARHLYEHGRLYPDAFRVPVYPITVAGALAAVGPSIWSARVLQCAILTLLAVATYALARTAVNRRRAIVAGLIVAWYPGLLLYTLYVMAEPLFTLLVVAALLCAVAQPTLFRLLAAGVLAGAATLTRQAGVAVVGALGLWALFGPHAPRGSRPGFSRRLAYGLVVAIGVGVAIAPWAARNYAVFGRWMPLETTGGITFLMSNYEEATGRYLLSDWETVHQRYLNVEPEEFSRNAAAYRLGWQRIREEPGRIASLVPWRLGYLFDLEGREHLWLYTSSYFGPLPPLVVRAIGWSVTLSFPLLVLAAIVALAKGPAPSTRGERLVVWVLAVMMVQLLTVFGDSRFHLPLVPLLAVLAVRPWSAAGTRRSTVRVALGALLIAAALAWWGWRLPAQIDRIEHAASADGWRSPQPY